jgi:uncharacterized protein (TIGR03905 family)
MKTIYKTKGTCTGFIALDVEDGIIKSVSFNGGCDGNLQAISRLVEGKKASDVIQQLEGIKCGRKSTSCPDQLSKALRASPDFIAQ